jgi:SNF2 family DNA or RNA helicase
MELYEHQAKGIEIGKQGSAIVVCPLSIIEAAWINDCKKFTPDLSIVSLWSKKRGVPQKRIAEEHDIYVCNPEKFKSLHALIAKKKPMVMFVDESSGAKNPKAQYTQALLEMSGIHFRGSKYKTDWTIPYRYVLSGTPAPNDQSEYWAQIKIVTGPGNSCFNDNFYAFRSKFFSSVDLGNRRKLFSFRKKMSEEFMGSMKSVCNVVRKEDVADLPEQVHEIRAKRMSPTSQNRCMRYARFIWAKKSKKHTTP